jgi:adenylate cyclase
MDYTIIGAEANFAARLQSISEPGQIVISYETYALARDILVAEALAPIQMKGISREVMPYVVKGMLDSAGAHVAIFSAHMTGLDFYLDPSMLHTKNVANIRAILMEALNALEKDSSRSQLGDPAE